MAKIIKCPIYTFIDVPALCLSFIDTPSFQRLNRIKQLGMCIHVYPSSNHTRKEHSLGVMHLAGVVVDHLRQSVPIPDRTKELIQLGALYHDIGHSAYSHLFDDFLESVQIADPNNFFHYAHHEERSIHLLRHENSRLNLLTPDEVEFVQNVILGQIPPSDPRAYLYEIVNNSLCGIDVDKLDYLRRDSFHTGLPSFQPMYIITCMVIGPDGHIAWKSKAQLDIEDLFTTRYRMFKQVYHHHAVQKICRIYKCGMKRLGSKLFQYGAMTDDMTIETLLRFDDATKDLMEQIDLRILDHSCDICQEFAGEIDVKPSGSIKKSMCTKGCVEVERLLQKADLERVDRSKFMQWNANRFRNWECAWAIQSNNYGNLNTALTHYAVHYGHTDCLKALHQMGAQWNGDLAVRATDAGQFECLQYIIESMGNVSINPDDYHVLVSVPCYEYLVRKGIMTPRELADPVSPDSSVIPIDPDILASNWLPLIN